MGSHDEIHEDPKRLPKLKKKYKKRWLKALRSGKYEQGDGTLLYNNKYCCLGVLCDVVSSEMQDKTGEEFDFYDRPLPPQELWELVLTKDSLKTLRTGEWAEYGWYWRPNDVNAPLAITPLTLRNDGNGTFWDRPQSFKRIANIIEKHM